MNEPRHQRVPVPNATGMGEKFWTPVLLALVVTIGMGVIFWPVIQDPAEKKFYGYGDSWTYYGPTQFYGDYVLHNGELPLWNPLILCGQPIAGNPQYANFYPPNVVRRILTFSPTPFRTHVGLALMLYVHVLIAALGTYALGRSFGMSKSGAFTAGIAFAFSAAFTQRIFGHLLMTMVVTWLPWCLFCLRVGLRAPTVKAAVPAAIGLGVTYSMAILAGTPQMTLAVGFALVVYWALERLFDAVAAYREKVSFGSLGRRIGLDLRFGMLSVFLAAGFAAPMAVPALQFFADTPRGTQSGEGFEKTKGDETFSVPEILAAYNGGGNYEGIKTLSAAGLIVALAGLFSPHRRTALLLAAFAVLLFDASIERSAIMLHALLFASPFPISSPGRGMMVAVLPLALLVGLGVDTLRAAAFRPRVRMAGAAIGGVLALTLCILIARRLDDFAPAMSLIVLVYPIAAAVLLIAAFHRIGLRVLPALVVCVLLAEAIHWRGAYIRLLIRTEGIFYTEATDTPSTPPAFWSGLSRDVWNKPNRPMYRLEGQINGFDAMPLSGVIPVMMPGDDDNRFWRAALPEWIAGRTDRAYLLLKRSFWLHSHYVEGDLPPQNIEFPPTTTVFLKDPGELTVPRTRANEVPRLPYSSDITQTRVISDKYVFTPENHPTRDKPLIWRSQEPLSSLHKVLAFDIRANCRVRLTVYVMNKTNEDPRHLAVFAFTPTGSLTRRIHVPMPDSQTSILSLVVDFMDKTGTLEIERADLIVDHGDERDRIHVLSRSANAVEVEVRDLPGPRILSCVDYMYPGWRAYVDDAQVPILKAFTYFKAVELPAGTHRVRFEFRPHIHYYGFALWLAAVIACAGLIRWAGSPRP